MNWRKIESLFVLTLALAVLTASFISGCSSEDDSNGGEGGPQVGKPAPEFTLSSLDGQNVSLSDFRGKAVLLNFWQSSCGPCRMEMPYLNSAFKGYSGEAVVLAVNVGESPGGVENFVHNRGLSFPVLLDSRGAVASKYQIRFFPTTFLIDRQGVIQDVKFGAFQSAAAVAKDIDKLID